ncbi:MAG TPA: phosphate ABC transporter permease PtsA [Ruminococcaceae bacterium]|mgnify:CR=1 FL=1|nr:MAG: phosphate ABC transporter, permease protein PstA [Clostridiales bacterium 41_21_two_genomes]HCK43265.1 phosphate ABC transporter permease PtsA [Oscillospiraceae bacterium]HCO37499.1 phosphate ABC transporter permease PtsA [Oscillospiraceae bacterium]
MNKFKEYLRRPKSLVAYILIMLSAALTVAVILFIIGYILIKGVPNITPELFSLKYNSKNLSMLPSIINTLYLTFLTLLIAVPVGVFSAIYLVEYAKKGSKFVKLIRVTNETLSGIPSIVYGLFGFLAFVIARSWGYSMIAGVITLAIMVLPVIIRTTEESLMAVDNSYREGSFGLGAGKLRTIFKIVLPSAVPGILSGIILAIGRIVGETAALIYTAGTVPDAATKLTSSSRTLSVHLYCLLNEGLHTDQAYATAVVLLVVVLIINALSSAIAKKISK